MSSRVSGSVVVARVLNVAEVPGHARLKACTLLIDSSSSDSTITVVTNAPNVKTSLLVVVARIGAVVEEDNTTITKKSVGGVTSEGMLCSCSMLGWKGHDNSAATIPPDAGFQPGDKPPASRPLPKGADTATTQEDRPTETLFARKLTKEEKKAAAEARKAKKAAKKAAGGGDADEGDE